MGQGNSNEAIRLTPDQISRRIASRFAKRCFSDIELYSFKDVFKSLAESKEGISFWTEDTLCRFLGIPDAVDVGALVFQAASFLGAFPFLSTAPTLLHFEAMVKVVAIFTGRYGKAMKKEQDSIHLIFRAFSEYDRGVEGEGENEEQQTGGHGVAHDAFAIGDDEDEDDNDDDDELALAALEALDTIEVLKHGDKPEAKFVRKISAENLTRLVMLLLLIAPLEPQESLALHASRLSPDSIKTLKGSAEDIVRSMSTAGKPVVFHTFERSVRRSLPHIFDGLQPLFEHMLFSKALGNAAPPSSEPKAPLLLSPGNILDVDVLCQLSFFLGGEKIWHKFRKLYVGSEAGFSMGSFEQKVFNWRAPTILLVSGSRMPDPPESSREKAFSDTLSPKRHPDGIDVDGTVTFGAYIPSAWRKGSKECFGDLNTKLFQLSPVHEVFETSTAQKDYIYFNKDGGIGFGSPVPKHRSGEPTLHMNLGAVSLILDESLEFGVFNHASAGGGAFHCSSLPHRSGDWQDRFEIDEIEVWGIGGDEEAAQQAKQWAWEEKEALARRNVNLGSDIEANRTLLEMAGIIGQNRSGGSV